MRALIALLVLGASPAVTEATVANANPIRKVVTMLQAMQAKVEEEGKKDKELFDKFMCYCKTGAADLEKSIGDAGVKMPALASDIKESEESLVLTKSELKQAQTDRTSAKAAVATATASREKEAAAFASSKAEYDATISSITKAVASLEKGMGGAFLQSEASKVLQQVVLKREDLLESDREELLAFLQGSHGSGYTPSGGEVTGILKDMGDTMKKSLAEATATEKSAISTFGELVAAKTKEINALTAAIESKTLKVGELGVSIVQMKNDLTDTEASLMEDKQFLGELGTTCKTKEAEWQETVKTRADELVALSETIKILNDDDALELFKKTLPGTGSSFVQVDRASENARRKALAALAQASQANRPDHARIDLIAVALKGKKDFSKVIALIDEMVGILKQEQTDDENKKEYCIIQLDAMDDKKKGLEATISDAETAIANAEDGIASLKEEIATLEKGIKALDKSVVEATEQRMEEHKEFSELMASDSAAKELLLFAKNRLNKFYNPKLYKPPPKRVLSEEDKIAVSFGGTMATTEAPGGIAGTGVTVLAEVSAHTQTEVEKKVVLPGAPEGPAAYASKSEENAGVIGMMDLLIKDLDKDITESETQEKESQKDYEKLMKDSAAKRTLDSYSLTDKTSTKASLEGDLETQTETKRSSTKELMATLEYISALHAECDWLLKYFDVRKEARSGEIDALGKAKDVLSGADYSLLQRGARGFLGRRDA
jgi:hypothetical protein